MEALDFPFFSPEEFELYIESVINWERDETKEITAKIYKRLVENEKDLAKEPTNMLFMAIKLALSDIVKYNSVLRFDVDTESRNIKIKEFNNLFKNLVRIYLYQVKYMKKPTEFLSG